MQSRKRQGLVLMPRWQAREPSAACAQMFEMSATSPGIVAAKPGLRCYSFISRHSVRVSFPQLGHGAVIRGNLRPPTFRTW